VFHHGILDHALLRKLFYLVVQTPQNQINAWSCPFIIMVRLLIANWETESGEALDLDILQLTTRVIWTRFIATTGSMCCM
jgi:hypothetical protein